MGHLVIFENVLAQIWIYAARLARHNTAPLSHCHNCAALAALLLLYSCRKGAAVTL